MILSTLIYLISAVAAMDNKPNYVPSLYSMDII